jgi:hypothetical protein
MTRHLTQRLAAVALGMALAATQGQLAAKNVDLSTVPKREAVQLTIYNSEDLTLVREIRNVSFKKGENGVQFSWANTLIDPTSVRMRFVSHAEQLDLLDTTFPHDKRQMLTWNIRSEIDGEATVEITYFTSGISWSADYVAITNSDETQMSVEGFVRIANNSGEQYEDAQVRLVVGKINLVEKIVRLAQARPEAKGDVLRKAAARDKLRELGDSEVVFYDAFGGGMKAADRRQKQVVKEGLSEYFIYTIEGTETIPTGWSKRLRSFEGQTVPFKIQYRYRPAEYGDRLVRMYLLTNDKESKLGTTPLPDGIVRVFRQNGRDGLSFVVAQTIKYVPIGDKIEMNLGQDPEVVFELVKLRAWRDDLWMQVDGTDVYRSVDRPGVEIEVNSHVAGWDDHSRFDQRIRNYTKKPIDVEIRRTFPGHVVFRSGLGATSHDYQTAQYRATVNAGRTADLVYEVLQHQGRNAKQSSVTVEATR